MLLRPQIKTNVGGIQITPALGLKAWATLSGSARNTVMIGDIPLLETEVNGVLREAIAQGLEVTSLHNTFLMDSPRTMSLHISATGSQEKVALAVGGLFRSLSENKIAAEKIETFPLDPAAGSLNPSLMEKLLWKGQFVDGVYRISRGRGTRLDGQEMGESTGVNSWAAFAGSEEHAVVNGEIASLEPELRDELKALIGARIRVVSIHPHMTQEVPKVMFVHFWGTGKLRDLSEGVKAAFGETEHHQSN